ncbi:MAG: hypothetical protein ACOYOB_18745 [Myxococcota bacterium]
MGRDSEIRHRAVAAVALVAMVLSGCSSVGAGTSGEAQAPTRGLRFDHDGVPRCTLTASKANQLRGLLILKAQRNAEDGSRPWEPMFDTTNSVFWIFLASGPVFEYDMRQSQGRILYQHACESLEVNPVEMMILAAENACLVAPQQRRKH